jgi:glycerol-3-phosphate acyltransferase PlsY
VWVAWLPVAYLLGTFPSAHLVARANGVDITEFGSGNPGASNVTRALGWRKGIWVFALDAAKGAVAAGIGLVVDGRPAGYWLGAAAILGHVYPITRGLRGGKGVATGGGVLGVLHPVIAAVVVPLWWIISRTTGKAAIASIVAVVLVPVGMAVQGAPAWEFGATIGICALIVIRHAGNVRRLWRREEHALSRD